jgi:hypothetical protein
MGFFDKVIREGGFSSTKAICNKGFSGNSSILPRSNFGLVGQESSPQSLTISYRHPLCGSVKTQR